MTRVATQRLTDFQLLMRDWRELAPYNFIHAIRLPSAPDVSRWENAITDAVRELGIQADAPGEYGGDMDAHLESELQRPFSSLEMPLRFFVVNERGNGYW